MYMHPLDNVAASIYIMHIDPRPYNIIAAQSDFQLKFSIITLES